MKAIILSAGQGKRLLPLTEALPKCLLSVAEGTSLLGWQLAQLEQARITEAVIVTGFQAAKVEAELAAYPGKMALSTLYNPFYGVADNLGSVWLAAATGRMEEDFLILNGDTLFLAEVPARLLANAAEPITLTISKKGVYDADDMKVRLEGDRLIAVGKTLDPQTVDGESIGLMLFKGAGTALFREAVERAMHEEGAPRRWYLSVIDSLSRLQRIGTVAVPPDHWCEVDFAPDLQHARETVAGWRTASPDSPAARFAKG